MIRSCPVNPTPPRPPPRLGIFLVGLAVALALVPMTGGDQYWHLSNGRWLLDHGELPWVDHFSFSAAGRPVTPHALLFDVLLELAYRLGGLAGVRVVRGLLPAAFGLSLMALVRRKLPGREGAAAWIVIGAVAASLDLAIPRPYWVPLILLPWCWIWIDRVLGAAPGEGPPLWQYFLLAWLWALSHGSVILAVVAPGSALVCDGLWRGRARPLAAACAAALVATVSTPLGLGIWRYLALVSSNRYHEHSGFVTEWTAPGLLGPTWEVNLALVVFLGLALGRRRRGPRWELLWTAVFVLGYTRYLRQLGLALMAAAVLAAEALAEEGPPPPSAPPRPRDGLLVGLAALVLLGVARLEPPGLRPPHVDQDLIPTLALDPFLETTTLRRLFHRFHWGGYLSWRSGHRVKAFFDGRVHLFGEGIHRDYQTILMARPGWQEAFDRYAFDGVLLVSTAPLLSALEARGGWRRAPFAHPGYLLLVQEGPGDPALPPPGTGARFPAGATPEETP